MKRSALLLAIGALLLVPNVALADSTVTPVPGWSGSYKIISPNGQYILVMLDGAYEPPGENVSPETDEKNKLLLKYPYSGLYKNDGSTDPLWVMSYVTWRQGITLSSDGRHLVVWGGWPFTSGSYQELALAFYEDGRLRKSYTVAELVANPTLLPHTVSHYTWRLSSSYDDEKGLLTVQTLHGEEYIFSMISGLPISSNLPTVTANEWLKTRRAAIAASVATSVPRVAIPSVNMPAREESIVGVAFLISAGSLGTLFTGVSILSSKRRKRQRRHTHELVQEPPKTPIVKLRSRNIGRKGTPRRPLL